MTINDDVKSSILRQINSVMNEFNSFDDSQHDDFSGGATTDEEIAQFNIRCLASIKRVGGQESVYFEQAVIARGSQSITNGSLARELYGIVSALRSDVQGGYLDEIKELIHADLFANFFEMGDYLLIEGYKDASAVIIGGILEAHIRKLAEKTGIETIRKDRKGKDVSVKAETLNEELGKKPVYNSLQQKSVTAWLAIRNSAAHAHYDQYDSTAVSHFSDGLKVFIEKHPA